MMRRLVQAVVTALLVGIAGPASAGSIDAAKIAAVDKAAAAFTALGKDSYQLGKTAPRESDPAVKPLVDAVYDTAGLAALAPIPFTDIDKLNDWSLKVVGVGSVYVFAGTGVSDPGQIQHVDEKLQKQLQQNTVDYGPEMGRYLDSSLQVTQALVTSIIAEIEAKPTQFKNPEVQHGLAQIRGGLKQTLGGVVTSLLTPGLDPAWMRARLPALKAMGPVAAMFLLPDDRKEVADMTNEVAGALPDPAVKQGLADFAKMMGS